MKYNLLRFSSNSEAFDSELVKITGGFPKLILAVTEFRFSSNSEAVASKLLEITKSLFSILHAS